MHIKTCMKVPLAPLCSAHIAWLLVGVWHAAGRQEGHGELQGPYFPVGSDCALVARMVCLRVQGWDQIQCQCLQPLEESSSCDRLCGALVKSCPCLDFSSMLEHVWIQCSSMLEHSGYDMIWRCAGTNPKYFLEWVLLMTKSMAPCLPLPGPWAAPMTASSCKYGLRVSINVYVLSFKAYELAWNYACMKSYGTLVVHLLHATCKADQHEAKCCTNLAIAVQFAQLICGQMWKYMEIYERYGEVKTTFYSISMCDVSLSAR